MDLETPRFFLEDARGIEEEEEDVCRVCRTEAEPGNPLMYPCKCSGSIRYVHPDCLKNWLAQSRKVHCELCGHKYTFSTVYAQEMPERLPIYVLVYGSIMRTLRIVKTIFRTIFVLFVWLVYVPKITLYSFNLQLWVGDELAKSLTSLDSGNLTVVSNATELNSTIMTNATIVNTTLTNATLSNTTLATQRPILTDYNLIKQAYRISRDLLTSSPSTHPSLARFTIKTLYSSFRYHLLRAQLLCVCLIGLFLGFFLLREWVLHHQEEAAIARATNPPEEDPKLEDYTFEFGQPRLVRDRQAVQNDVRQALAMLNAARDRQWDEAQRAEMRAMRQLIMQRGAEIGLQEGHEEEMPLLEEQEEVEDDEDDGQGGSLFDHADQLRHVLAQELAERDGRPFSVGQEPIDDAPEEEEDAITPTAEAQAVPLRPLFGTPGLYTQNPPPTAADVLQANGYSSYTNGAIIETEDDDHPETVLKPRSPPRERPPLLWNATVPTPSPKLEMASMDFETAGSSSVTKETPADSGESAGDKVDDSSKSPTLEQTPAQVEGDAEEASSGREHEPTESRESSASPVVPTTALEDEDVAESSYGRDQPRDGAETPEDTGEDEWEDEDGAPDMQEQPDVLDDIQVVEMEDGEELPENEEFGLWDPEEWDGVMDMIGLRGSLVHLFGNITIACVVLQTAAFVVLSLPAIIGKVTLLLNAAAIQRILLAPIRLVRFLTDRIVDAVVEILIEFVLIPSKLSRGDLFNIFLKRLPSNSAVTSDPIPGRGRVAAAAILERLSSVFAGVTAGNSEATSKSALASRVYDLGEGVFALLGRASINQWTRLRNFADGLAGSAETRDRAFVILWGYIQVVTCVVSFGIFGEDFLGSFATPIVAALKQQAIILKLLFFMIIELVGFPFGAGIGLQACLLPLFPNATFASRFQDFISTPFLSVFVAWLFGTLFMFSFASLLARFREACRPGTMFFVRDPQDHNYSPVKDIVERSTFSQIRKLAFSAWMYGVVITWLFGAVPLLLKAPMDLGILPLRISQLEPLSSIPFDMVFIHICLPATIAYLRPERIFKVLLGMWWRRMTRMLRLSSFMFNKRVPAEESPRKTFFENHVLPVVEVVMSLVYGKAATNESLTRVPFADKVALLTAAKSKGSMFVQVDEHGVPRTDEGKMKVLLQNQVAVRNQRDPSKDYTIVWLPSYFQARINLFLLGLLATGAASLGVCAYVPLITGRALLERILKTEPSKIHDGYSYGAGFYFLWAAFIAGRWVEKKVSMMDRAPRLRRSNLSTRIKRGFLTKLRDAYRLILIGGLWPILCGLIVNIYVLVPLRYGFRSDVVPVIHVWEAWALGCAINSMFVHITDFSRQAPVGHVRAMRILLKEPLNNSVQDVTLSIRPLVTGAVCMIAAPGIFVHLAVQVNPTWKLNEARNVMLCRLAYVSVLCVFLAKISARPFAKFAQKWVSALRDKHYGIESRLENYEKEDEGEREEDAVGEASPAETVVDGNDRAEPRLLDEHLH